MENDKPGQMMEQFATQASEASILYYPDATINDKNYYGMFKAPDLFEMLCESLIHTPR